MMAKMDKVNLTFLWKGVNLARIFIQMLFSGQKE